MQRIKLMGAIGLDWGEKYFSFDKYSLEEVSNLKKLLSVISKIKKEKFWIYFDDDFTPKRGTIIIINGIDYNVFGGLDAEISENDEIVLIPTISGG